MDNLILHTTNKSREVLSHFCKLNNLEFRYDYQGDDMCYYDITSNMHFIYFKIESNKMIDINDMFNGLNKINTSMEFLRLFSGKTWSEQHIYNNKTNKVMTVYRLNIQCIINLPSFKNLYKIQILKESFIRKMKYSTLLD